MSQISVERVRQLLDYDPETGVVKWKALSSPASRVRAGAPAGSINGKGYVLVRVDGVSTLVHRIAFAIVLGKWPTQQVDHVNGCRSDNRWSNLREATRQINMQNERRARSTNRTGFLGVTKQGGRFRASIWVNGAQRYIGSFDTPEEAHIAYVEEKRQVHKGCTL